VSEPPPGEKLPPTSAPTPPSPVLLQQSWRDVVFVHWSVDPEAVTELFPAGTRPDTLDGMTYVGIVGFAVPATVVGGTMNIGGTYEVNVRLYSIDDAGRQGVVFLSMDVTRPDMVVSARTLPRLPYMWSHIEPIRSVPTGAGYRVERRLPSRLVASVEVEVGEPLPDPAPLDVFVTARWGLHARQVVATTWIPVVHEFWTLHQGRLRHADEALLLAAGVPAPTEPAMSVLWSPGVDASIGRPAVVEGPGAGRQRS
jgi:uncharacterized protein YqjF (DUF2071 family)